MNEEIYRLLEQAAREDGRYPPEAYAFLLHGLELAAQRRYGEAATGDVRHVTGRELCEALRDLAVHRWGRLAGFVLSRWGVHRTRDFGELVFVLVQRGLLGRQEEDHIEDFDDVYDFRVAFEDYEIPLASAEP
jgi:uncharacterized repeat protein (TIGR04138 family)